ncbi:MAG: hypothetical protein R2940_07450 [Syntrophotaleaceae bacterium]
MKGLNEPRNSSLIFLFASLLVLFIGIPDSFSQTPGPPSTYEAEAGTLNGVGVEDRYPGFTGNGYVAQFGQAGDSIEFVISVPRQDY